MSIHPVWTQTLDFFNSPIVIEPSAAVPVAAALDGRLGQPGQRVGIVLSGGNVDLDTCPFLSNVKNS